MPLDKNKARQFRRQLTANGQIRNRFEATILHSETLEEITHPSYWYPASAQMRPFDVIACVWEDGSRTVDLRILARDERAQTVLVMPVPGSEIAYPHPPLPKGYSLAFQTAALGWRIEQEGRNAALASGFHTAIEAVMWLNADARVDAGVKEKPAPATAKEKADAKPADKPAGDKKDAA